MSAGSPGAFDPAEGAVELHALCLLSGSAAPAGPATLLCSVRGGPPLALGRVALASPQCKVRLHLESDPVAFTCSGAGEVLLTGVLRPREEGAGRTPAVAAGTTKEALHVSSALAAEATAAAPPPSRAWDNRAAARGATAPVVAAAAAPATKGGGATASTAAAPAGGGAQKADTTPKAAAPAEAVAGAGATSGKKRKGAEEDKPARPVARKQLGSGLEYEVTKPGAGPTASVGKTVQVRYEGRLARTGQRFDKGTIKFRLGVGEVIRGWDEGVKGMQRGERRRLLVPARLGYGSTGAPPLIPSNANLVFEVELLQC